MHSQVARAACALSLTEQQSASAAADVKPAMLEVAADVTIGLPLHARSVPLPSLLVHVALGRKVCKAQQQQ